jgi:hypothetical protein
MITFEQATLRLLRKVRSRCNIYGNTDTLGTVDLYNFYLLYIRYHNQGAYAIKKAVNFEDNDNIDMLWNTMSSMSYKERSEIMIKLLGELSDYIGDDVI